MTREDGCFSETQSQKPNYSPALTLIVLAFTATFIF